MFEYLYVLIALLLIFSAIIYFYPTLLYPIVKVSNADLFDLSLPATLFDTSAVNLFETDTAATFQCMFYINPLQRTPTAMMCGTEGNPDCHTGRFNTCVCTDDSCVNCNRNGYIPILQIGDSCSLEILQAPDAGRQGKTMAQLAIHTHANSPDGILTSGVDSVEVFPLPALPLQRWVMVTIVREGRRFHIYYDNGLVLSQQTEYYISTTKTGRGISCGSAMLNGKATLATLLYSAQTGSEIAAKYSEITDTRGVPYLQSTIFKNIPKKISTICPSGACNQEPTMRPAQPWLDWDTDYA